MRIDVPDRLGDAREVAAVYEAVIGCIHDALMIGTPRARDDPDLAIRPRPLILGTRGPVRKGLPKDVPPGRPQGNGNADADGDDYDQRECESNEKASHCNQ
jgi:hypothetical protein